MTTKKPRTNVNSIFKPITNKMESLEIKPLEPGIYGPKLCECGPESITLTTSTDKEYIPLLIPEQVSIIGKKYKIDLIPENDNSRLDDTKDGECDHDEQILRIRTGKANDYLKDTVLHEIMHGIEHAFNLDLTEKEVTRLATGLLAVFNDNPELREFLLHT